MCWKGGVTAGWNVGIYAGKDAETLKLPSSVRDDDATGGG